MSTGPFRRLLVVLASSIAVGAGLAVTAAAATPAAPATGVAASPLPPTTVGYARYFQVQLLVNCAGATPTSATFSFDADGIFLGSPYDVSVAGTVTGPGSTDSRAVPLPSFSVVPTRASTTWQPYQATVPLTADDLDGVVDVSARAASGYEYAGARTPVACGLTAWNPFDGIQTDAVPGAVCNGRTSVDMINTRSAPVVFTYVLPRGQGTGVFTVPAASTSRLDLGTTVVAGDALRGYSEITRSDGTDERIDVNLIHIPHECQRLNPGDTLGSGQTMDQTTSNGANGLHRNLQLIMQSDGNLVLYESPEQFGTPEGGPYPMWYSSTAGHPGATATLRADGNLVVSSPTGEVLWSNRRSGTGTPSLQTDDVHGIVEYSGTKPVWEGVGPFVPPSLASGGSVLAASEYLAQADQLVNGPYTLAMQYDGNLVERVNGRPVWFTATRGNGMVFLQSDGNLVVRDGNTAQFSTGTYGHPGDVLRLQTDGNVVLYDQGGRPLWWTGVVH